MQFIHNKKLVNLAKNLRKAMTPEERHLWYDFLREYPVRFYRQKVIGNYIVDFYCPDKKLVIELDGSQHYEQDKMLADEIRTKELNTYSITVLCFSNKDIKENFRGVCEQIDSCFA